MILTGIISLILLLAMITPAVGCAAPTPTKTTPTTTQPVKLIFSFFEPPASSNYTLLFKPWFDDLEKRSGGKLVIERHLSGELVGLVDTYDAVLKGTVDMGFYFPMMNAAKFYLQDINSFFSYDVNTAQKGRIVWDLYKAFPEMQKEFSDSKLLWAGVSHSCGFATVKVPIRKLEDAKGLKFTTTGKWNAAREQALGMVPTSMPPEATVPSLQNGVLDGMGVMASGLRDLGWGPALRYLTMATTTQAGMVLVMNLNKWNSLPADIQKLFTDTVEARVDSFDTEMIKLSKERLAAAPKEFNMEIITLSKDEINKWVAVDKPVIAAYTAELNSKGLPGTKLVDEFLKLEKKYAVPNNPYLP